VTRYVFFLGRGGGLTEICTLKFIVLALKNFRFPGRLLLKLLMYLTFLSPVVTLHITNLTSKNSTLCSHCIYMLCMDSRKKTVTLPYRTTHWFCKTEVESVHCAVRTESLSKTGTLRL